MRTQCGSFADKSFPTAGILRMLIHTPTNSLYVFIIHLSLFNSISALELSCSHRMEDLAVQIVGRADFALINQFSPQNFTCLMQALKFSLPRACLAILDRPDFSAVSVNNLQRIERNAYQMCLKKAEVKVSRRTKDPEEKLAEEEFCETFAYVAKVIRAHPNFVLDMTNHWTVQ